MTRFKIDRRTVIKGAGTIAIALPWLEIMGNGRRARAQTSSVPLKRFVTVYQPGGAVRQGAIGDKYTPTGTETSFTMSPVLMPLQPYQSRLMIVDGLNLTCGDQFEVLRRAASGRRGGLAHRGHPDGVGQLHCRELALHRPGAGRPVVGRKAVRQPAARRALGDGQVPREDLTHERDELFHHRAPSAAARSAGHVPEAVRQSHRGHRRDGRHRRGRVAPEIHFGPRRQEISGGGKPSSAPTIARASTSI